jgi:hypothetical protein
MWLWEIFSVSLVFRIACRKLMNFMRIPDLSLTSAHPRILSWLHVTVLPSSISSCSWSAPNLFHTMPEICRFHFFLTTATNQSQGFYDLSSRELRGKFYLIYFTPNFFSHSLSNILPLVIPSKVKCYHVNS